MSHVIYTVGNGNKSIIHVLWTTSAKHYNCMKLYIISAGLSIKQVLNSPVGDKARQLTVLLVEHNLSFELYFLLQGLFYLKHQLLIRLHPKQKLAAATLLHDFSSCKPGQLTEAI